MTQKTGVAPPLRAYGASDVGRRRMSNEDRFHVDTARGIFIVVDGVGGQAAGDKAAEAAIAAIVERLERQTGALTDRLREAIAIANNEVYRLAASRPEWRGMACVATAAVIDGDRAVVGHVGDSRLYRLADGAIEKITPDHSPVGEREDANEMSELEAMRHPRRNEVYRDVGSEPRDVADPAFAFVTEIAVAPGTALLLCSDGLTDLVASETIRQIAATHAGAPERLVRALIDAANEAGGKDNITAIYVERPGVTPVQTISGDRSSAAEAGRPAMWRIPVTLGLVLMVAAGFWLGLLAAARGFSVPGMSSGIVPAVPSPVIVRPEHTIMAAVTAALPGTVILVEPGEYRERVTLRDGIRLLSRLPLGATIRLPADAAESDAAVIAAGITGAELSGFRIVGDAGSPLGVGVIVRDAAVRLVDLDISGAITAAVDLGTGTDMALSGSFIHDNPGSALVVRSGATPRISNNVFARNASSDLLSAPVVVESGAVPLWSHNVFDGMAPDGIAGLDAASRAGLPRDNWFVSPPSAAAPAVRRSRPAQ
jgi:serine/threonine protein phosphatase PrpC